MTSVRANVCLSSRVGDGRARSRADYETLFFGTFCEGHAANLRRKWTLSPMKNWPTSSGYRIRVQRQVNVRKSQRRQVVGMGTIELSIEKLSE
jgi:hypothetical protein